MTAAVIVRLIVLSPWRLSSDYTVIVLVLASNYTMYLSSVLTLAASVGSNPLTNKEYVNEHDESTVNCGTTKTS